MGRVFVGVGSSIEPEANVRRALTMLDRDLEVLGVSTFYRTPALRRRGDPPFVNGVAEVSGALRPGETKEVLRRIERALGRRRGPDRYAARPIDLDLLVHGDHVIASDALTLPNPDLTRRAFVALPLLELAPDLTLPGSRRPLAEIAASLPPYPMEPLPALTADIRRTLGHGP